MSPILFWLFSVLMLGFGVAVITNRNPVASALSLVVTFFCLAALYIGLEAYFLGAIQVVVYAGAVISAVDLEKRIEDVTVCAVKRLQRIERGRTVDQDVELIDRSGQPCCSLNLLGRDRNGVRDVAETARRKELRLGQCGHGDRTCCSAMLHPSNLDRLVRFDVRPEDYV